MARHIGIVAVSPEGSASCYRLIGRQASAIPEVGRRPMVSLHNRPLSTYVEALARGDWNAVADLLRDSARALAAAGAEFCVLPDNVCHHALPMAETGSPIPWLNMIDLVADALRDHGYKHVGLIGTKYVTYGSTYQTALGLRGMHLHVPPREDADAIDEIIFSEAVHNRVRRESRTRVQGVVRALKERGCEAL
ncbi:MAG: aspartate/glutamate racemase family protein, partial [Planctomycetota bacterium]|nr:aspartate/glutamate racemase family protein [Planctomycetota bacterium]